MTPKQIALSVGMRSSVAGLERELGLYKQYFYRQKNKKLIKLCFEGQAQRERRSEKGETKII